MQIAQLPDRISIVHGKDEDGRERLFEGIVGRNAALLPVLRDLEVVAPTDSGVLMGEAGTGKELIARAIRDLSAPRDRRLIKLNCGAIPSGLLESEVFGHEGGVYQPLMRKAGRFEVANKGTLFLDEVLRIAEESVPDVGVRPFALLARKYGVIDWVRAQKETWSNHGDWDRRAIIWSASVLPMDERRRVGSIWVQDTLERAVAHLQSGQAAGSGEATHAAASNAQARMRSIHKSGSPC